MKEYELIHEILNLCPMNHSRDRFLEEIECESPEQYLLDKFGSSSDMTINKTVRADGTEIYEVLINGMHHRFTFS